MNRSRIRLAQAWAGLAALAALAPLPFLARAESAAVAPAPAAAVAPRAAAALPAPAAYQPSFGDLMTMAVQPRHTKLGLAGQARNWTYARYELNELRNAFARIARTIPVYRTSNTGALFTATTDAPLAAVGAAIDERDAARFRTAYAQLTASCNACHAGLDHAAVVIRVPGRGIYPDQQFEAAD